MEAESLEAESLGTELLEAESLEAELTRQTRNPHFDVFRSDLQSVFGPSAMEKLSPGVLGMLHQFWCGAVAVGAHTRCESCGEGGEIQRQKAMTRYFWDGTGEDPNADLYFCSACAEDYTSYWKERWQEYFGGLL